jgi:hypothetical protein
MVFVSKDMEKILTKIAGKNLGIIHMAADTKVFRILKSSMLITINNLSALD